MRFDNEFQARTLRGRKLALAIAAALAACASTGVYAADEGEVLEEMIVTAQKREQSLQNVPMAVSALSSKALSDAGVHDVTDLSRQAPVLEVQSSVTPLMTNFRIRRVGNLGNIPTFEPAVGLFVDGAFRSRSIFGASEMFDVERVEILRGPQSTLYGKNTTAGVIGVYTKAPGDALAVNGEVSAGNLEGAEDATLTRVSAGVSGPLGDTFGAGLSAAYAAHDATFGEALTNSGEEANDMSRYAVRGQMQWQPTDAFKARLIVGAMQEDDKQITSDIFYDPNGPLSTVVLPAWRAAGVSDTCSDNDPHNRITCVNQALTTDLEAFDATLLASYEFAGGVTLNSITSWDQFEFNGTMDDVAQMMAPLLRFHDKQESESLQQELRLTSPGGQTVDWLGGVFYYTNEFSRGDSDDPVWLGDTLSAHPAVAAVNQQLFRTPIPLPMAAPGQVGYLDSVLDTEYLGVYGQAAFNIGDAFSIIAGARWQEESKEADIQQWVNIPAPSVMSVALAPAAVSANGLKRDTSEVTWSLTPQWRITEDAMVFATAAHGFKSGGFNTGFGRLPIAQREFDDEDIMHYEAGLKLQSTGQRVRLATSVFLTEYENYQDAAFVGAQFTVSNAEKVELKGAEIEGAWLITDALTADLAVSYADLVYETNTRGMCYPGRASDSTTTPGACDLSGEHPVNAPEWKTHLGLQYEQPLSFGSWFTRADWSWTDDYNTSFSADPRLVQSAYDWINLRTGLRFNDYEVMLWADNVTNETVTNIDAVVTLYAAPTDGSYQSLLQQPRSYGVTLRMKF